jgi:hypothetical protein
MTSFQAIVNALGARRSGQEWIARCPVPEHKDKNPSARIAERDGKILFHCFGGCTQREFIGALQARGLSWGSGHREWVPREQWKADRRDELAAECWRHMLLRYVEAWQRAIKPFIWDRHEHAAAAKLTRRYFLLEQKLKAYSGGELLTEYRRARAESPEATAMLVRAGAEDIDHAHDAAALVVRILEARQHGIACAPRS